MKTKRRKGLFRASVKRKLEDISHALTILDISVIFAIAGVTYFTLFSYYNANVIKTEEYLWRFLKALEIIDKLGLIAFVHMIYSLFYMIYTTIQKEK